LAIKLIIAGLRRSGTTIFWESFRQDPRLLCYDEPFNELLHVLPARTGLKAPEEFLRLVEQDPQAFWERFAPIHFSDELREGLSDRQAEYLRFLGDSGDQVAIDVTRCQFKLRALRDLAPRAVLVHLHRPPESLATSHLLPSSPGWRGKARQMINRRRFWSRSGRYDYWSFESIVGRSPISRFGRRLEEIGLDPVEVYRLPAVGRLLAFWRVNYERAERDGERYFRERFVSQRFDDFCRRPRPALQRIYELLGMELPDLDLNRIHPPHGAYQSGSGAWARYRQLLGLPES
jgi:hypothetical protein